MSYRNQNKPVMKSLGSPDEDGRSKTNEERRVRKYKEWRGKNTILFAGRIIGGPEVCKLYRTIALVGIPSIVFAIFVGERFWSRYDREYVLLVGILLALLSLATLLTTAFTDPGIIPRKPRTGKGVHSNTPRLQDICVDGKIIRLKYCRTCNIIRPPRSFHCPICDNCVERFDHHCPWIGTCIGLRNYVWFSCFVWSTAALCTFCISHALILLTLVSKECEDEASMERIKYASRNEPLAVFLVFYVAIALCFVLGLCFFHLYLVATNRTTNEQLRGLSPFGSEYSVGFVGNIQNMCCVIPESSVHIHHKELVATKKVEEIQKKTVSYVDSLETFGPVDSHSGNLPERQKPRSANEVELTLDPSSQDILDQTGQKQKKHSFTI